jgi:hypothetical protein
MPGLVFLNIFIPPNDAHMNICLKNTVNVLSGFAWFVSVHIQFALGSGSVSALKLRMGRLNLRQKRKKILVEQ